MKKPISIYSRHLLLFGLLFSGYSSGVFALSDTASRILNDENIHVLTSNDVQDTIFSYAGTVVINDVIEAEAISISAENILVLDDGVIVSNSTISLNASNLYGQDGELVAESAVTLNGSEHLELDGNVVASKLNLITSDLLAKGEWNLTPENPFIPAITVVKSTSDVNFFVDIEATDNLEFVFATPTNVIGQISSNRSILFSGGADRLELSPLLTINGLAGDLPLSISTRAIGEFFINTPLNVDGIFLDTFIGSTILENLTLSHFGAGGEGDITIQSGVEVNIDGSMGIRNRGSFTLLGSMNVLHPNPETAGSVPFEIWPGDEIIIQGGASIVGNVRLSFVAGFIDFEPGDHFINFGSIDIDLVVTDSIPFQSDEFINFGSIDLSTTSGNTGTLLIQSQKPVAISGQLNADVISFIVFGNP